MTWLLLPVGLVLYTALIFGVAGLCGHNTQVEQAEQRWIAEDVDAFLSSVPGIAVNTASGQQYS